MLRFFCIIALSVWLFQGCSTKKVDPVAPETDAEAMVTNNGQLQVDPEMLSKTESDCETDPYYCGTGMYNSDSWVRQVACPTSCYCLEIGAQVRYDDGQGGFLPYMEVYMDIDWRPQGGGNWQDLWDESDAQTSQEEITIEQVLSKPQPWQARNRSYHHFETWGSNWCLDCTREVYGSTRSWCAEE